MKSNNAPALLAAVTRYQKRISGPMLDRTAARIHIEVPRANADHVKLTDSRLGESSEAIRARVERARQIQNQRFNGSNGTYTNADTRSGPAEVRAHCKLDDASTSLVRTAMAQLQLSARAFLRTRSVKLASSCPRIQSINVARRRPNADAG